jgi:hypothetical protein
MTHSPTPTTPWTGTIQLFLLPHLGTNQASTIGDHSSLRLYGHVARENMPSWEYDKWDLSRNGSVPKVKPRGMPCNLKLVLETPSHAQICRQLRSAQSDVQSKTSKAKAFRSLGLFNPSSPSTLSNTRSTRTSPFGELLDCFSPLTTLFNKPSSSKTEKSSTFRPLSPVRSLPCSMSFLIPEPSSASVPLGASSSVPLGGLGVWSSESLSVSVASEGETEVR